MSRAYVNQLVLLALTIDGGPDAGCGGCLGKQRGGMPGSELNSKAQTVTLHMVSSLDGFIAKKDNTVSWLDSPGDVYERGVSISAEEAAAFVKTIDCYVL